MTHPSHAVAPVGGEQQRKYTAAGRRERIRELEAMADYYDRMGQSDNAQFYREEAEALEAAR
jgi:hypothetical protein